MKKKKKKLLKKCIFIVLLSIAIVTAIVFCITSWNNFTTAAKILLPYSVFCLFVALYDITKTK